MSYKTNSWVFESKNGGKIYLKIVEQTDMFKIYYDDEDEHFILFEKEDITELVQLLYEIQDE